MQLRTNYTLSLILRAKSGRKNCNEPKGWEQFLFSLCEYDLSKVTGVSGVKKHVDLLRKIPSSWCKGYKISKIYFVQMLSALQCVGPWLFYSSLRGHFWHFYHFYENKSSDTSTSKFCIKVHFNGLFCMKKFDLEIFVNFGWFWQI